MKFNIGDLVFANTYQATIQLYENDRYLVHYVDGIGSDWMHAECLKKVSHDTIPTMQTRFIK